jgi:fructose-specific phosphotransferase system IIC component
VKRPEAAVAAFVLSIVLFAAVVGLAVYIFTGKTTEGTETHEAICALVADLETRTEGTRLFLTEHPKGIAGIPASTLRESLQNQERTIGALSVVSCP